MGLMDSARFVRAWEDRQLEMLRQHYGPEWDIWLVREFPGLTCWLARLKGDVGARCTAESPEELVKLICQPSPNYKWSAWRRKHA